MDLPGVVREKKLEKLGMHASDTALLAFNDVRVPDDAILGEVGKGFYHIMWELQGERLIGAAGCVAGAQRAFDRTLQYALERKAFGREIGHFQVIRHKFADMATKIEAARQLVYSTAWRFQNGEYPVREISMAKLYAARVAVQGADECIQIHGGAGDMKEDGVERWWRQAGLVKSCARRPPRWGREARRARLLPPGRAPGGRGRRLDGAGIRLLEDPQPDRARDHAAGAARHGRRSARDRRRAPRGGDGCRLRGAPPARPHARPDRPLARIRPAGDRE